MQMRPNRTWQDPHELSRLSDQELFAVGDHNMLKTAKAVFFKLYELTIEIGALREWQIQQLSPLYYSLLSAQNALLDTTSLAKFRDYYPGFANEYDITSIAEIENWVWDDYRVIKAIWERFDDPEAQINPEIKQIITTLNTILSGDSIDNFVISRSNLPDMNNQGIEPSLTIYPDGHIEYRSADGKIYFAKLKINSQGFILLELLTTDKKKIFSFTEINDTFKSKKQNKRNVDVDDAEGRSRSAAKYVRHKLQIPETDQLLRSDYGFHLRDLIVVHK